MIDDVTSPLQQAVQEGIARTGKSRDYLDGLLRDRLKTTGKPLWDIERAKSKKPEPRTLRAIEVVLELAPETLVSLVHGGRSASHASTPPPRAATRDADETVEIIALDLSLSMGPGTFIEDFVDGEPVRMSLGFIQAITRTPTDRLRLVKGIGDSMEPTLRTGDQVLVDINERQLTRINGVYWIDHQGMHGIKRLRGAGPGRLLIGSDNPLVPDFEVDAQDVRIEGRVIWFARQL